MSKTVEIGIDGRRLSLTGGQETYLDWMAGDHSELPLARLVRDLPPASTCLDVGANIGVTALIMASRDPQNRVFAFEPVPGNAAFLRQNLSANRIENCTVVESAVGAEAGHVSISDDGPWSLVGGTADRPATREVPMVSLDRWYAATMANERVDFIKIDVEGFEPNVLTGATTLIERWRPLVFMEFNSLALVLQNFNPLQFATALFQGFEVSGKDGSTWPSAEQFIRDNMVRHQAIDDLLLRPRDNFRFAGSFGFADDTALRQIYASTSWRVTAPLRAIRTLLRR